MKHNFIEENIIILSKQTLDLFLAQDNPADLIALYCFYYYTAKWQKTNQPRATVSYVAKGLKWGTDKARNNKKLLIGLGLIEDIRHLDEKTKKVKGWYVKVKYIWKQENHPIENTEGGNHPINSPQGGLSHRVGKSDPNALSVSSINALNVGKETASPSDASLIPLLIELFVEINPACGNYYKNTTQRKACERLIKLHGFDQLKKVIALLPQTNGMPYFPSITTPVQLEDKWASLESALRKKKGEVISKGRGLA